MIGVAIFAYQTLDSMDGKQARKTNSSSALGMVFDHGCDAINAGTTVLAMAAVFGTGWSGKLLITYFGSFTPFYIQTWEEYYTGCMIFPAFNGPTQGLLMAIVVCFIQFYTGNEFFHQVNQSTYQTSHSSLISHYHYSHVGVIPTALLPSLA
jgi:ethanolaminephosphotransferase